MYTKNTGFYELDGIPYDDKSHVVFYNASAYTKVTDNNDLRNVPRFVYAQEPESEYTDRLDELNR